MTVVAPAVVALAATGGIGGAAAFVAAVARIHKSEAVSRAVYQGAKEVAS